MKRNLIVLTGIVFVLSILVAVGCKQTKQTDTREAFEGFTIDLTDTTKVWIYLQDTTIGGSVHLLMYDSRKPGDVVVDDLVTEVYGGYTVFWDRVLGSNIHKIEDIRPVEDSTQIFIEDVTLDRNVFKLHIPTDVPDSIEEKYEIEITLKDSGTWVIDPYLRIPNLEE